MLKRKLSSIVNTKYSAILPTPLKSPPVVQHCLSISCYIYTTSYISIFQFIYNWGRGWSTLHSILIFSSFFLNFTRIITISFYYFCLINKWNDYLLSFIHQVNYNCGYMDWPRVPVPYCLHRLGQTKRCVWVGQQMLPILFSFSPVAFYWPTSVNLRWLCSSKLQKLSTRTSVGWLQRTRFPTTLPPDSLSLK